MQTLPAFYDYAAIQQWVRCAKAEHPKLDLMGKAGQVAWQHLAQQWPSAKRLIIICGPGNNGGDGMVLARHARQAGCQVTVCHLAATGTQPSQDARQAIKALEAETSVLTALPEQWQGDLVVDALLGIGVKGEVSAPYQAAIAWMNQQTCPILSLDVPSGLQENKSQATAENLVCATETLTFVGIKKAFFSHVGLNHVGRWTLGDIGIPFVVDKRVMPAGYVLTAAWACEQLPPRAPTTHKGQQGHTLVLGAHAEGLVGAGLLAGEAALRIGSGLSTLLMDQTLRATCHPKPELMVFGLSPTTTLNPHLEKASSLVIGPGLGQSAAAKAHWSAALAHPIPKVVDADGLNFLAQQPHYRSDWVLTPHPGEAARLLKTSVAAIEADRAQAAAALAKQYGGVVVLKGAGTQIASATHAPVICPQALPVMATGGMGDVLAGLIGGLLAQGVPLWHAACIGVAIHAEAAARTTLNRGALASDLFKPIVEIINAS